MRLADIERRMTSLEELSRIVGAMRSVASMRVQEAMHALASVRAYGETLEQAVREALAIAADERPSDSRAALAGSLAAPATASAAGPGNARQPHRGRRALVLCTSEHGFVGAFNERVLDAAAADLDESDTLLILGSRGAALALERGLHAKWTHPMATRLTSVPEVVRALQEALYPLIARAAVTRAQLIFVRAERSGAGAIERHTLFPLELTTAEAPSLEARSAKAAAAGATRLRCARLPPLHNLPAAELLERLAAEYLLARLTEAATESLASENGARFAAMESAHDNVERKLGELQLAASRARQEEVTTELLDLVTGAQAVGS